MTPIRTDCHHRPIIEIADAPNLLRAWFNEGYAVCVVCEVAWAWKGKHPGPCWNCGSLIGLWFRDHTTWDAFTANIAGAVAS